LNQELTDRGGVETTNTPGPRIHNIEIIAGVLVWAILCLTFTLLTDIKIGVVIATFFCMMIGAAIGAVITARSLQRHDQIVGRNDVVSDTAPILKAYVDDLREQAREQRELNRELMDELRERSRAAPLALPAPEVPVADYQARRSADAPLALPLDKPEQPDYFGPVGLRIKNMPDAEDAVWFDGVDSSNGGKWGGWFSADLLQHFFETQWPEVGRVGRDGRKWERDDAAYGWAASLLVLLTALVPVGRSWNWHENFDHDRWVAWANELPRATRRIS